MTAHGWFHKKQRDRPTIVATISHPSISVERGLEFLIDTGAENTLVVPYWEGVIGVDKKSLVECPYPIDTIGGEIYITGLPNCTVVFSDQEGAPYPVENIMIYFFSAKQKKRRVALKGEAVYPNLIGRDILNQVSLGYCQTSEYLFVTKEIAQYRNALMSIFPPPIVDYWARD
jgi:hypothetical protein